VILTHGLTTELLTLQAVRIHSLQTNAQGCTNTATLNLTIKPQYYINSEYNSLYSYTWSANGVTYTASGVIHSYFNKCSGMYKHCNVELNNQPQYNFFTNQQLLVEVTPGQ